MERKMQSNSTTEHDEAIAAAFAEGARTATQRLTAALSAEGVKGDGARTAAALSIAAVSPDMTADDIASLVVTHIAPAAPVMTAAESYSASRAAASEEGGQRWTAERQEQAQQRNAAARDPASLGADRTASNGAPSDLQ